jgi:hypothetical protein
MFLCHIAYKNYGKCYKNDKFWAGKTCVTPLMVSLSDKDVTKRFYVQLKLKWEKTASCQPTYQACPARFLFAHSAYLHPSSGTACGWLELGQKVPRHVITSVVVAIAVGAAAQTAAQFLWSRVRFFFCFFCVIRGACTRVPSFWLAIKLLSTT